MRAVAFIAAALLALPAGAADDLPPDGASWGCASAAYFERVQVEGHDGPAFRALYSSFFKEGSDGDIAEHVLRLVDGAVFVDDAPRCWDFNGDGAPDPVGVVRSGGGTLSLVAYVRGAPFLEITHRPEVTDLSPVALRPLRSKPGVDIAYLTVAPTGTDLVVTELEDGRPGTTLTSEGFADPTGIDHRVPDFARDCGAGPEIVLPSTGWKTLDVVRVTDDGLTRASIAESPDFSRLVRALECRSE